MNYTRYIKCPIRGCEGIVEAIWENSDESFKKARCPSCKRLFEPYVETRLRLMEVEESTEVEKKEEEGK